MPEIIARENEPAYKQKRNSIPYSVSIPRPLVAQMDAIEARDGYSRSGLIQQALREFLARRASSVTDTPA